MPHLKTPPSEQPTPKRAQPIPGLVSVIIGAYNIASVISQTLDSVLSQTYAPLELIVVDDGSTDGTWEVLQSYGERIVAVRQANGGVAAARNTGLHHARGEFIALMDHDDLCMPERIAAQVACLKAFPQLGLCSTEFSAFSDQGHIADIYSGHYYSQCDEAAGGAVRHYAHQGQIDITQMLASPPGGAPSIAPVMAPVHWGNVYDAMACGNLVHPPTVMFRASLLDAVGEFDLDAGLTCDWDWLVKAAKQAPFGFINRPLLNYRRSATQISSERYRKSARLDTLYVAERIAQRDPDLWRRQHRALKNVLIEITLDAAYVNAEARPKIALQLVAKAIKRYHVLNGYVARIVFKALVPQSLLQRVRGMRPAQAASN